MGTVGAECPFGTWGEVMLREMGGASESPEGEAGGRGRAHFLTFGSNVKLGPPASQE